MSVASGNKMIRKLSKLRILLRFTAGLNLFLTLASDHVFVLNNKLFRGYTK